MRLVQNRTVSIGKYGKETREIEVINNMKEI